MAAGPRLSGPAPGQQRPIDRELIIGREAADLTLDDSEVSRRHAAIRPVPQGVEVEDLGSRNGTFIDGRRIEGRITLSATAVLRIGSSEMRIELPATQPTRLTPVASPRPEDPTVARPRPDPALTAMRPVRRPEQTVRRDVPLTPGEQPPPGEAEGGRPPGGGEPPAAGGEPPGPGGEEPPRRSRKPFVLAGAGVLAVAAIAAVLVLVLGGGSKNTSKNAAATGHCGAHFPQVIHDGFPEPRMIFSHDGVLSTTLTATTTLTQVNENTYSGMQYDGSIPGPTYVICPGDTFNVDLQNKLPLPTNLHVHGLHVSPSGHSDNIFVDIKPLQSFQYSYKIPLDQSPGSFWYHPHLHPLVDPETTAGLLGAIIVEGGLDDTLANVPQRIIVIHGGKPFPKDGVPLPIPGAKPGQIKPPPDPGPTELLVNGVYDPTLHIRPGEIQRWRIFNATGERELKMALPGVTFQLLAQDGTTLTNMIPEKQILIGAGSRVEVLVRGMAPGTYDFSSLPFQPCFKSCFDPFGGIPNQGRLYAGQPLITVVSSGTAVNDQYPNNPIGAPPDLRSQHVDVQRTLVMSRVPGKQGLPTFPYNGKLFNPNRVDVTMKLGSIEEWTLVNPITAIDDEWHTFHIHTNNFQVVSVNGKPVNYVDWQDNVNLAPGDRIVILIHPTDFTGKSVFHCHLTFHEDNGMMGVFQVLKNPTVAQVQTDRVMYMVPPNASGNTPTSLFAAESSLKAMILYCRKLGLLT